MTALHTSITDLLGIEHPVVQAGMSWVSSTAALPAAVSRAGGLGVLAAGPLRPDALATELAALHEATDRPFAVNLPLYRPGIEEAVDLVLARPPRVLIASQGGPARLLPRFRDAGVTWLHVVASVEHAEKAVRAGVDGLVVVGAEAGGHPPEAQVTTLVLVRAVATALPGVPVVASGGFADGAGLAAALCLGAGAAQFGTRFIASSEAAVHPAYRDLVLAAGPDGTRTVGRGIGMIRALRNEFTDRVLGLERAGAPEDDRRAAFAAGTLRAAAVDGDVVGGKVEAGQTAGLVDHVQDAASIVSDIVADCRSTLRRLAATTS